MARFRRLASVGCRVYVVRGLKIEGLRGLAPNPNTPNNEQLEASSGLKGLGFRVL